MRKALIAAIVFAIALGTSPVWAQKKSGAPPATSKSFSFSTSSHRGRLGVQVMSMTEQLRKFFGVPKGQGVLVAEVKDGTPGKQAGLRAGDVVLKVDGDDVSSVWDVRNALADRNKGERVDMLIVRSKARRKLSALLDTDPAASMFRGFKGFKLPSTSGKSGKGQSKSFQFDFDFDSDDLDAWIGQLPGGLTPPNGALPKDQQKRLERLEKRMKELEKKLGGQKGAAKPNQKKRPKLRLPQPKGAPPKAPPSKKPAPKKPAPKKPAPKKPVFKLPTTTT